MTVVTRFPPSPTGFMHIGNARTALFNWLYARRHNGKFVVRIEDTDRKRYSEEAVQAIMDGLEWLGLDFDGEATSQFARLDRHTEVAMEMIEKGQAYYCYCSAEELDEMRENAKKTGQKTFYDRRWRDRPASDAPKDVKPVVRIKAPIEGTSVIEDQVQGVVKVENDQLDDFIILRSDGTPTYMLSVVVDDHDMDITHVIRGDDHLNNSFRQKIIFDAMGWTVPIFAHLPLIHGQDGGKFSKRHGAQGVLDYRDLGFLPDAVFNYLLRLGWSHGDDEIIPRDKAVEWFDLEHIGKSPAKFDVAKLESLNAHYINETSAEELVELAAPFLEENHNIAIDNIGKQRIIEGIDELKSRSKTLIQFAADAAFYAKKTPLDYTEKAQNTLIESKDILEELQSEFSALEKITSDDVQNICKQIAAEKKDGKMGKVAMPLRAAITGTTASPSVFHAAEILGKDEVVLRIQDAIKRI